jgi:hypothetical protein
MTIMWQTSAEGKCAEAQRYFEDLQAFIHQAATGGQAVHEVERGLFQRLLQLGHQLLQSFFDLLGDGDAGATVRVSEDRELRRLPERHRRPYQSIFGQFALERVVYGTREGQRIEHVPLDTRLRLPAGQCSYLLQDWDQALAVELPYQQVNGVLERWLGLKQSVASLEQMSRELASAAEAFRDAQPPVPVATGEQVVVLSGDGKGIPLRKPATAPRIHAHQHQRGPKPERKKLAVVGTVYQIEPYRRTPKDVLEALFEDPTVAPVKHADSRRPHPQHKRLRAELSAVESAPFKTASDEILGWLTQEAAQRDPAQQHAWVVLMDGQATLWEAAERALGDTPRVEILDLLHATGYLWDAVHLFHPPGSSKALALMKLATFALLSGQSETLIRWLPDQAVQVGLSANQRERLAKYGSYLHHHRDRMHYDQYLAAGYPIASGVIEGACRHVVKDRMERAGMHWTVPGAQAMLALRCIALNGDWEAFMQYRIEQESARLYPDTRSPSF